MSVFMEASAGTGKTTQLVNAIADAIEEGVRTERIAAVTYTHQAAGEMKGRVREELQKRGSPRALAGKEQLDRAFIGTIHAFCAALLRKRPVEACVDPDFREMDASESRSLFRRVFRNWLRSRFQQPSSALRRAFAREAWKESRLGPVAELEEAAWALAEWRDHDTPWRRDPFDRQQAANTCIAAGEELLSQWPRELNGRDRLPLAETIETCRRTQTAGAFDLDDAEAELTSLVRRMEAAPDFRGHPELQGRWRNFDRLLHQYSNAVEADFAPELQGELWSAVRLYTREKDRHGVLDFTDLLVKARALLQHPGAREDLRSTYERLFVDEFQDTDPVQIEVLRAIAPEGGLFVVGDPKQCIYRFRRADPRLYAQVRSTMRDGGAQYSTLNVSHRSNAAIQEFVNAAFRQQMESYLPLEGGSAPLSNQPAIVALPAPRPYYGERFVPAAVLKCMPDAVAAFVAWLTSADCTWRLRDGRPIKPGDVCILFRRATNNRADLTEDYVRALEARNLPHLVVGSRALHQREEVLTLRTALRAIEWPDDELSVYATLRGPLFGITDTILFRAREAGLHLRPGANRPAAIHDDFVCVVQALDILAELRRRRNSRPVADTLRNLLDAVRGHAVFAFHRGGPRKLGNLHRVLELARQHDARARGSFRHFVEWLEAEADAGEGAEAPIIESSADGVQLMTAHKAKGLEFPVVILADPTAGLVSRQGCARWIDTERRLCAQRLMRCAPVELLEHEAEEDEAEREEGKRVAYVAATRAKDLLVVCALGDREYNEGWLSPLYPALYPAHAEWRNSRAAPGCPPFGSQTVFDRPERPGLGPQIKPGQHRPRTGAHSVVWFDPALLNDQPDATRGTENERFLDGDSAPGLALHREWHALRQKQLEAGRVASLNLQQATQTREYPELHEIDVRQVELSREGTRKSGRPFGRLVHKILEHGPEVAYGAARSLALTEEDVNAALNAAAEVLQVEDVADHEHRVHREYPLAVRMSDGTLVEGRADMVIDTADGWVVVDYKTGRDAPRAKSQVQIYCHALQQATGRIARGLVIQI